MEHAAARSRRIRFVAGAVAITAAVAVVNASPAFADVNSAGPITLVATSGNVAISSENISATGAAVNITATVGNVQIAHSSISAATGLNITTGGAGSSIDSSTLSGATDDLSFIGSGSITNTSITSTAGSLTISDFGRQGAFFTISGSQLTSAGDAAGGLVAVEVTARGGCIGSTVEAVSALELVSPTQNYQISFPTVPGPSTCMPAIFSMGTPFVNAVAATGPSGSNGVEIGDPIGSPEEVTGTPSVTLQLLPSLPILSITSPATGQTYDLNQHVPTSYVCQGSCTDSNGASGGSGVLDTSTAGAHSYVVTDSNGGITISRSIDYTVNKGTPAITWALPAPIVYGTALSAAQLDATSTVSGTFTYSPAAGAVLGAGTQTLNVTFTPTDSADYNSTTASVPLTVTPALLTVSALSFTRAYGQSNPPLLYNITGFVNGDTSSVVSGAPVLSTTATASSNVGVYPISVSIGSLSAANYTFGLVGGTLTVVKAPTKLVADPLLLKVTTSPLGLKVTVGIVSARLTNAATGGAVAGQRVVFRTISGQQVCAATTNASGVATCTTTVVSLLKLILTAGYRATFAGTNNYLATSATAPVIKVGP